MQHFRLRCTGFVLPLLLTLAVTPVVAQQQDDTVLSAVKRKIQKAEKDRPLSIVVKKDIYKASYLNSILIEIDKCFSMQAGLALAATLRFDEHFRETPDQTKVIRRPVKPDTRHKTLGKAETAETITITTTPARDSKPVVDRYVLVSGDSDILKRIGPMCFLLKEAMKDTPLLSRIARRESNALKCLNTLVEQLPVFADRNFQMDGLDPYHFKRKETEVEGMRTALTAIYNEYMAEMKKLRNSASKPVAAEAVPADLPQE